MTAPRPGRRTGRRRAGTAVGTAVVLALTLLAPAAAVAAGAPGPAQVSAPAAPTTPTTPTTPTQPTPAPDEDDGTTPVTLDIVGVNPGVLRPEQDLRVTVRVENPRSTPVEEPRVVLHLDRNVFISRSSLDRWRSAGPDAALGASVLTVDLEEPIAAQGSTDVTLTLPAESVGLRRTESSWGPRGIAAQVVDRADPARTRLGVDRSFLLWFPVEDVTPTRVSVLVPMVGPAIDPYDDAWVADLEALTAEDGRLGRVLGATAAHPDVTWVVDPWLVDVTRDPAAEAPTDAADVPGTDGADSPDDTTPPDDSDPGTDPANGSTSPNGASTDGPDPDGDPGAADDAPPAPADDVPVDRLAYGPLTGAVAAPGARAWVERLLGSTVRRDVELLPYLDPDVAALAHAGDEDRLSIALALAEDVVGRTALPDGARSSLGWPADPLPDTATAGHATRHGERAVVVGPGELPPLADLTYTPSGRAVVGTDDGTTVALVPDARLSAALRTGSPLPPADADGPAEPSDSSDPADGDLGAAATAAPVSPAVAAQDLLAELAVITRERPSDSRHMLLTTPRDWSPDPAVVDAQLTALEQAPWVQHESVSALVGAPETGIERGRLPTRSTHPSEISPARLTAASDAVTERLSIARIVPDPEGLVGDTDAELLAPVATAWRADPVGRAALVDRTTSSTRDLRGAVQVLESSTVNLLATSGGVPVRVGNALPQEATVQVMLRPGDARLRADEPVTVTIPPGGEELVRVPVHAIQSADLQVGVAVSTPDGETVDDGAMLLVRVRAEWEGIGTAVIAALLAVGLVLGVVRAIRRGRTTGRRARPITDRGPDALSPEAHAPGRTPGAGAAAGRPAEPAGRPGGT